MANTESCPRELDIPSFLQDEMSDAEREAFVAHLAGCPICAAETARYRDLINGLHRPLPAEDSRDLAPLILARLSANHRVHFPILLRAAALFLCLVTAGALIVVLRPRAETRYDRRADSAVAWLCSAQDADGHWDAKRWGAQKNYTPGITGLAVLALLKQDANALNGPRANVLRSALDYLIRQQNADGRIGAVHSGTPYNQGIATLALLEAHSRQPDARWGKAVEKSLAYIRSTQQPSGGWGYPRAPVDANNTSITVWQLQALLRASAMGYREVQPSLEKGLAWLNSVVDTKGRIGYSRPSDFPYGHETLTAAGAFCFLSDKSSAPPSPHLPRILQALRDAASHQSGVDYYRLYFMTQALAAAGGADTDLAMKLRNALILCQSHTGDQPGSFETTDRWSSAGGRVYATAMAVLAL